MSKNEERYLLQALKFEGVLRAYLYRFTRDGSEVEELLQQTYARLLTAAASDEPQVLSIRAFSFATARDIAVEHLRHKKVVPVGLITELEAENVVDEGEQVEEIVSARQELAALLKTIQDLPKRCRQAFTLRKVYGYSQKELASRLDISESEVRQHLTTAARRCAQALFEQSVAKPPAMLFGRFARRTRVHEHSG